MFDTPGVYVQEIPSGSRPISGVSTSNSAFVGPFQRGPVNQATRVTSFGEFERIFGGLMSESETSYAVRSYFLNGGSVAFIVRVTAGTPVAAANVLNVASVVIDANMTVSASPPGAQGNNIRVAIAHVTGIADTFSMLVREYEADLVTVAREEFFPEMSINSAVDTYVGTVVAAGSEIVTVVHTDGQLPTANETLVAGTLLEDVRTALEALAAGDMAILAVGADGVSTTTVTANSVGTWGNNIRVGIAHNGTGTTFTMIVREFDGDQIIREEAFLDVSVTEGNPRYVETVVAAESEMITVAHVDGTLPSAYADNFNDLLEIPAAGLAQLAGGDNGIVPDLANPADNATWIGAAQGAIIGSENDGTGIYALNAIVPEVFNIMCLPDVATKTLVTDAADGSVMQTAFQEAYVFCRNNNAFLLIDVPPGTDRDNIQEWFTALGGAAGPNSAMYYPRLQGSDPLNPLGPREMPTSGYAAGLYARTDATRGVWKAPAGTEAAIVGAAPTDVMTDRQQGTLNPNGINAIRTFPVYNSVIWGARTLDGADARASEWRYVNVRRLTLFIESSLQRGLQWVVFEKNDEPLWSNVRLNVNAFMGQLHKRGAFEGASARDAFLVKCDSETTTPADVNLGVLNVYVGYRPPRPAEFVVIRIQQRFANAA